MATSRHAEQETPGQALNRLVRENGRAKWWVAKQLDIHPSLLSRIISGERPMSPDLAVRLAEIFDVPVETFIAEQPRE